MFSASSQESPETEGHLTAAELKEFVAKYEKYVPVLDSIGCWDAYVCPHYYLIGWLDICKCPCPLVGFIWVYIRLYVCMYI